MSSGVETESETMQCCASCGKAGSDDIKLRSCTACYLVKYCSVICQKDHRSQHKKECKKRAAELHDEILFKQPESSCFGDCPICCLPLPIDLSIDAKKAIFMTCCSKRVCAGCCYATLQREEEERLQHKCPFCRWAMPIGATKEREINERLMKRIEVNDPIAMCSMGKEKCFGGDYQAAFEYWTKAAALGNVEAHYQLSMLYYKGKGVEKNEKRELHHAEQAAIGGHPDARHNLGCLERDNGRMDRAAKHLIIASKLGNDRSLERVKDLYKDGFVSKDDFTAALRGYQTAIIAMKSPQRDEAAEFAKWQRSAERKLF